MSKLIITTTGTSVIRNKLYPVEFNSEIKGLTDGIEPRNKEAIITSTVSKININLVNNLSNEFLSAELASLRTFKNNKELGLFDFAEDMIALFSTDTEDGKFCTEVNKRVLEKLNWCKVLTPVVIEGLKTKKTKEEEDISKSFKEAGLIKLKEETEKLLNGQNYTQKYFNVTGGFKATIPFVTILAIEKGMSLIYLYEESNDLIFINPQESYDKMRESIRIDREIMA
jgi:putative CRISPR-associated protein (TIGR02619 family)